VKRYLLDTGAAADMVFRRLGVHDRVKEASDCDPSAVAGLSVENWWK
jgi:hypothetical protein